MGKKFTMKAVDPNPDRFAQAERAQEALASATATASTGQVTRAGFSLPLEEKEALDKLALALGLPAGQRITTSRILRAALKRFLQQNQGDQVTAVLAITEPATGRPKG